MNQTTGNYTLNEAHHDLYANLLKNVTSHIDNFEEK